MYDIAEKYIEKILETDDSIMVLESIMDYMNVVHSQVNILCQKKFEKESERKKCDDEVLNVEETYSKELEEHEKNKDAIDIKLEQDINNINKLIKELDRLYNYETPEFITVKFNYYKDEYEKLCEERVAILEALKQKYKDKKELLNIIAKYEKELCIEESYDFFNKKVNEIKNRAEEKDEEIKNIEKEINKLIDTSYDAFFENERLCEKIRELINKNNDVCDYTNPLKLPEKLEIGRIGITKEAMPSFFSIRNKKMAANGLLDSNNIMSVPYEINRKDGYALSFKINLHNYYVQLKKLILKQLMCFPAGRLELLMLDKSMTPFFSDFVRTLNESENKNIIGTKVWGEDNEIAIQISEARKRLSGYIREYGNEYDENIIAREQRENFRLIIITGFPLGFSMETLEDLSVIVKEGGKYGVYTIIHCDNKAISKEISLYPQKEGIINEILKNTYMISEKDNYLYICRDNEERKYVFDMDYYLKDNDIRHILSEIAKNIGSYDRTALSIEDISPRILDENNWLNGSTVDGITIPIGRRGYDEIINVTMGKRSTATKPDTRHHMLIEGATGSGKSNILHTMITLALLMYDPSELEIYYLDYKEAVEASVYSEYDLPMFRLMSVNGERAFGLKTLSRLVDIMKERYNIFRDAIGGRNISDIEEYRKLSTKNKMPRILLIIDEIGRYLDIDDDITRSSLELITELAEQGRSAGIHMIFTAQLFEKLPSVVMKNMSIRIACGGSVNLLDGNIRDVDNAIKSGYHAIYNEDAGNSQYSKMFRIAHIDSEKQKELLKKIDIIEQSIGYEDIEQKIIHSSIDCNRKHVFNSVKMYGKYPEEKNNGYDIYVGECFDFEENINISFTNKEKSNLLVVGDNAVKSYLILYFACLSLIQGNLIYNKSFDMQNINIIDLGIDNNQARHKFNILENMFSNQIRRYVVDDNSIDKIKETIRDEINRLYEKVIEKSSNDLSKMEFLIINGIEYLHMLIDDNDSIYKGAMNNIFSDESKSISEKIRIIMKDGPEKGINCIFIIGSYEKASRYLGEEYEKLFTFRIAFDLKNEIMDRVVMENKCEKIGDNSAIFFNPSKRNNRLFRIYDYPKDDWIMAYAKQYNKLVEGE